MDHPIEISLSRKEEEKAEVDGRMSLENDDHDDDDDNSIRISNSVSFEPLDVSSVETLKKWIDEQTIIPPITDKNLKMFLHSCYYDLEATKNTLIAYYSLRIRSPELFSNRNVTSKSLINASLHVYCTILPGTTPEGYKVCVAGPLCSDNVKDYDFKEAAKFMLMAMDIFTLENSCCPGFILITDLNRYSFSHIKKFDLQTIKSIVAYYQDAFPIRLKKIVVLKISTMANVILNMALPFMNERIRSLIDKYTEEDYGYFDIVPPSVLPVEYGGENVTLPPLQDETMEKFKRYKEWFAEEDKIITSLASEQIKSNRKRNFFGLQF